MKPAKPILTAAVLACLTATAQIPDSLTISKVTVTGHRLMEGICVDTSEMAAVKSFSLGDMLQRSSSVNMKSYGRGAEQTAVFRGTSATHTAVYWNGLQINSPLTGAVDFSLIPMEMVDNVTVEAGTTADNHGAGALGGAVVLKNDVSNDTVPFGLGLGLGYGSFSTYDGYAVIKAGSRKVRSDTRIYATRSKNDFTFTNRDIFDPERPGWHPEQKNRHADYSTFGFMEQVSAALDDRSRLSAVVWGNGNLRNLPQLTAWEGDENSNLTDTRDRALRANVEYKRYGSAVDWSVSAGGTLEDNSFEKRNRVASGYVKYIDTKGFCRTGQLTGEIVWRMTGRSKFTSSTRGIYASASSTDYLGGAGYDKHRTELSETATVETAWNGLLSTSLSARAGEVGGEWFALPTAGVGFKLGEASSLSVRGDMDVHFPTLSDLYYIPGGNSDLRKERSATAELGYAYRKNDLRIIATAYYSYVKDWILWLPTSQQFWTPKNILEVDSYGLEATAGKVWHAGAWKFQASGCLTVNITKSRAQEEQMSYVPPVSWSVFLEAAWKGISLSYQGYGESAKYASLATSSSKKDVISAYFLQDVILSYTYRFITVEGACRNILDSRYYGVLRRPMAPRSFEIRARLRF